MHILKECLSELRFIGSLKPKPLKKHIQTASPRILSCIQQIALNILYSGLKKNGLPVKKKHVRRLRRHKKSLIQLVNTKSRKKQRKILKREHRQMS